MVSYSTPAYRDSEDDHHGGHQLKILSPLPRVPWDLPPLPSGACAGVSPPSVRQCHRDPQDVRHEAATCRRTRSQKRRSVDDAKEYTQRPVGEERERSLSSSQGSRPARLSVSRHEAPPYLIGNPFILSGYRRCITLREACQGLFYQHNSWLDTWTSVFSWVHSHVLLFVASYVYGVFGRDWLSAIVFASFYLHVAWIHAPASIVCHLVGNAGISQHVYELCLELDYLGIFIASVILAFTQAVFVYPWWGTLLNVLLAIGLTAYLVTHIRQVVLCHIGRLRMLLEIGSLYQLPLWFQAYQDCTSPSIFSSLPPSLLCACGMTGSLVVGGLTYALHFPERFAPGKFDVWWNSHALMHVWINVAMLSEFLFLLHMFLRRS